MKKALQLIGLSFLSGVGIYIVTSGVSHVWLPNDVVYWSFKPELLGFGSAILVASFLLYKKSEFS